MDHDGATNIDENVTARAMVGIGYEDVAVNDDEDDYDDQGEYDFV